MSLLSALLFTIAGHSSLKRLYKKYTIYLKDKYARFKSLFWQGFFLSLDFYGKLIYYVNRFLYSSKTSMIDNKLRDILAQEQQRQAEWLEMIASENYVSPDVLAAYNNVFTNKYSEWYPWARYYGWNDIVDELEIYTQQKALALFWLDTWRAVNVQPLSWSPANLAVYMWVIKPWDTVLAMDLNAWGHLSHGHKLNASAMYYNFVSYGLVRVTMEIDYDDIRSKALTHKPAMIIAWFSAYPKHIDWQRFATIADEVSKVHGYRPLLMADIAHIAGLIVWGVLSSPFPFFDIVTTTTHKTLRWPRWALIYMRKDDRDLEKKINRGVFPWLQWWPHEHVIYAKAVAFDEALQPSFKDYARSVVVNAQALAAELVALWWPVLTWTTENHIVLLDVTKRSMKDINLDVISNATTWHEKSLLETWLTWKIAEHTLEKIWISVNKNLLPFDTHTPMDPSGIRLGTPAITTRWLWVNQMKQVAWLISRALEHYANDAVLQELHNEVKELCKKFPLPY